MLGGGGVKKNSKGGGDISNDNTTFTINVECVITTNNKLPENCHWSRPREGPQL